MLAFRQLSLLQRNRPPLQIIIPVFAGCIMVCASILPWLNDPLYGAYSAWALPIDIGLQFHIVILNYGLLCFCCAVYGFLVAYASWKPFRGSDYFLQKHFVAGLFCIIPVVLFLLQYLFSDVSGITMLAQHLTQMLLMRGHFGYTVTAQRILIQPFAVDTSTFAGRLELLANQVSIGPLIPCLSASMLIYSRRFLPAPHTVTARKPQGRLWAIGVFLCMLAPLIIFWRAPVAIVCEEQARASLNAGDYEPALRWLDTARFLNPALDQVAYYHIERGQAWYFLHPAQQNDDSHAYLAFVYRGQGDFLDAYQELQAAWHGQHTPSWVVSEMSITLERLAEFIQPPKGSPTGPLVKRLNNDANALPWLQLLIQVDPSNVYGHYVAGRIQYDLHNYTACIAQMSIVIQLSSSSDVQSSAYTYIGLSDAGQGNYVESREVLLKAVQLDPNYHNNTAREELSGLR